jgi:phosphonate transport system ATP-binding protein|tara:strand:- start:139 stop:792 length:654 start_codon:yes stop_codon:yes gene_type:complete
VFVLDQQSLVQGRHAVLNDISLQINAGEKVALVGPSGAGKSSLLSWLWQQHSDDIALCPQEGGLVDILSVYQNIYMGGLSRHSSAYNLINLIRPWSLRQQEVYTIAELLGIDETLAVSPDRLSGGQRQRVALGRALYRNKPIFFGDEPVSSLDPKQGDELLGTVLSQHKTAVVAIHSPELALKHFTRVIALNAGRLVGDWQTQDITLADIKAVYSGE